MLIRFTAENWMSFRGKISLSMIASKERQHRERVPFVDAYKTHVLPIAAVYGANASGKTNLFRALAFAKEFVVRGSQPDALIPVESYRLDSKSREAATSLGFEILVGDSIFDFSFRLTRKAVLEEKLVHIRSASERTLYHRKGDTVEFDSSLPNPDFLAFCARGTRTNQLFLTNSISQRVEQFRPIYDWFRDTLMLVAPDSRFSGFDKFIDEGDDLHASMNEMLTKLDTGIVRLGGESVPFASIPIPEFLQTRLQEDVKEGNTVRIHVQPANKVFAVTRKNGELLARKLVSFHATADGEEVGFEIEQESDGSQRVIDLLPAFLELASLGSRKVVVVDELDRSLHSLLTRRLLEMFLATCSGGSRSQLLMTTHDVVLMDQDMVRRDEMWIAEREMSGESRLFSFSEFKDVRYDKDVRKSYLQGRLGGVPRLLVGRTSVPPVREKLGASS